MRDLGAEEAVGVACSPLQVDTLDQAPGKICAKDRCAVFFVGRDDATLGPDIPGLLGGPTAYVLSLLEGHSVEFGE